MNNAKPTRNFSAVSSLTSLCLPLTCAVWTDAFILEWESIQSSNSRCNNILVSMVSFALKVNFFKTFPLGVHWWAGGSRWQPTAWIQMSLQFLSVQLSFAWQLIVYWHSSCHDCTHPLLLLSVVLLQWIEFHGWLLEVKMMALLEYPVSLGLQLMSCVTRITAYMSLSNPSPHSLLRINTSSRSSESWVSCMEIGWWILWSLPYG